MCLIFDANLQGELFSPNNEPLRPFKDWLQDGGKILYAKTPKFMEEMDLTSDKWQKFLGGYSKRGINVLRIVDKETTKKLLEKQEELAPKIKSDDPHIVALALVTGTKLLISGDNKLQEDFKNKKLVGGAVYQYNLKNKRKQRNLLERHDCCP